jgi:hypothetical protein
MKRLAVLLAVSVSGCSTMPVADVLDFFKPARLGAERTPPYGGVCAPTPVGAGAPAPVPIPASPPLPTPVSPAAPPAPVPANPTF